MPQTEISERRRKEKVQDWSLVETLPEYKSFSHALQSAESVDLCESQHSDDFPKSTSYVSPSDTDGEQHHASPIIDVTNAVRVLAVDAIENANSGHPGMVLGMAPAAAILWDKHMNFNPSNPDWINRDRFILSAGHGSMLQYALMYLFGFDSVCMEDIKKFRKLGSRTAGHPENTMTHGVEVMTGALGQGISNAVGIALAETHLAAAYNRPDAPPIIDHFTYCIVGDGCLMEGVAAEACSLAGHWRLGKLIVLYDDNSISIEGSTNLAFTEDVSRRFRSYGWHVQEIADGNTDVLGIDDAILEAKNCLDQPSLIKVTTTIGYGAPTKAGSKAAHGGRLGTDEVAGLRKALDWPHGPFEIPEPILSHTRAKRAVGAALERSWDSHFAQYREQHPALATQFEALVLRRELPSGWANALTAVWAGGNGERRASTRELSHVALNAVADVLPSMLGGSADLGPSNLSRLVRGGDYQWHARAGRNLHFGVREHGMGSIANGVALYRGGLVPFVATFLVFSDYMRAAIRTAALARAGVIFVLTHDSILLGEDGPTHQPVEHLASFRAMPGVLTLRPACAEEVAVCYEIAIRRRDGPSLLVLSRQRFRCAVGVRAWGAPRWVCVLGRRRGRRGRETDVLLIATGSEVGVTEDAARAMRAEGYRVRVVSMPCVEVFQAQDKAYRRETLNVPRRKRVVVEAGARFGWYRYAAHFCTVDRFGASGSEAELAELFKITANEIAEKARAVVGGLLADEEE